MPPPSLPPSIPVVRGALVARRLRLPDSTGCTPHVVATGRTGSGKTTLANRLLGVDYFVSDGRQDCTREVNHIRFPGGMAYSDLPGVCSDDRLENVNRLALGLPQVEDAPTADGLTVATYTPDHPPARNVLTAEQVPEAHPAPDLILYLLAADKQFTSADRRYLRDLLARHSGVVYVLNIFGSSPPSEPNIRDLTRTIVSAQRRMRPSGPPPRIVLLDCLTGEGMDELLGAARQVLGGRAGEHFADVIRDVDRATPRHFAGELSVHLLDRATGLLTAAGPADARHPLRAASLAAFDLVAGYGSADLTGGRSTVARFIPIVADSAGRPEEAIEAGPDPSELAADLRALADQIIRWVLPAAGRRRDGVWTAVEALFREEEAAIERRMGDLRDREADLDALAEQVLAEAADLRRRSDALDAQADALSASLLDLRARIAVHEAEIRAHEDAMESHNDRVGDLQSVIDRAAAVGLADPSDARRLERECDRSNLEGRRLDRQADRLNSESRRLRSEIDRLNETTDSVNAERDRYNRAITPHNERVDAYRSGRSKLAADRLAADRDSHSSRLARGDFLSGYYGAYRTITEQQAAVAERAAYTVRRCDRPGGVPAQAYENLRARLWLEAMQLSASAEAMHRQWYRFRVGRQADRVILDRVVDHFDETSPENHRGTTFLPVGADGAATVLAAAMAAAGIEDYLHILEPLKALAGDPPSFTAENKELLDLLEMRLAGMSTIHK